MDVNTLYAAVDLGAQDAFETEILKEVWSNNNLSFQNFTSKDFEGETNICEKVYEKLGSEGYNKCYNAAISSNTARHNALVTKYAEAQAKGYTKSFEQFKRSSTLGTIGDIAGGLLSGLFGNSDSGSQGGGTQGGGTQGGYYPPQKESKTGLYIGLGAVALIGIGTAIYFATRKK